LQLGKLLRLTSGEKAGTQPLIASRLIFKAMNNAASPVESVVKQRYAAGAQAREAALCCPVAYDQHHLKVIPQEVIDRDYGCGDPSRHVHRGETVLDLGSGTGKICFIASQVVGPEGRVIGIDMTDAMLEIARRNAPIVAERIGYANVEFRKGRIQDLALDLEKLDAELCARPIIGVDAFLAAETLVEELRMTQPLVAPDTIDVVVSNCVLNLVAPRAKRQLFGEIFRVLKLGGRAVISDIVSDEAVPDEMQNDPELWSGCISGALTEQAFLEAFEQAEFHGIQILERNPKPWRTVRGIEFRSMTVEAFKGKQGTCFERNQAVIYKGPFKEVLDDDSHRLVRGERQAVCDKTFQLYRKAPYLNHFEFVEPLNPVASDEAGPFDCHRNKLRHPRETKGLNYDATTDAAKCCDSNGC
jgi:ubiquinone/menaquinone biosynthesis C-methylase UbiE